MKYTGDIPTFCIRLFVLTLSRVQTTKQYHLQSVMELSKLEASWDDLHYATSVFEAPFKFCEKKKKKERKKGAQNLDTRR
jgi:hypothetical protein